MLNLLSRTGYRLPRELYFYKWHVSAVVNLNLHWLLACLTSLTLQRYDAYYPTRQLEGEDP